MDGWIDVVLCKLNLHRYLLCKLYLHSVDVSAGLWKCYAGSGERSVIMWWMSWPDCWVAWHDLLCIWCLTRQDSKFPTGRHQWKITVFKRQPAIHVPHSRRSERAVIPCDISLENESQSALMEHILYDRLLKSTLMNWGGHRLAHPYVDGPDWKGGAPDSVDETCVWWYSINTRVGRGVCLCVCVCVSLSWRDAWKRARRWAPPCLSLSPPRRYLLLSWGNRLNIHERASNGSAGLAFFSQGRKWRQIHAWGSLQVGIQGQLNGWFKGYKICMMSLFYSRLPLL